MQNARQFFFGTVWVLLHLTGFAYAAADPPPNIVFMLSDDQAWNGLSVRMHREVEGSFNPAYDTPHTQRLAKRGMRFSAAYAPAPVCAPTRISLMTGQSPAALHWTKAGPSLRPSANPKLTTPRNVRSISSDQTTFAELLQDAGYTTAHFGKWHLDGGGPERHGFDVSDGNLGNEASEKFTDPNPVDLFGMAERAEAFMRNARDDDQPFYVQLSWHALHSPGNALQSSIKKYEDAGIGNERRVQKAAITHDLDTAVGRVMDAVDRLGLGENTYIIFMSDNGGTGGNDTQKRRRRASSDTPTLTGGKGSLYEGGLRVPLIVAGPGIAPGSWCDTRVVGYDLYPTFLDWAGVSNLTPTGDDAPEGGSLVDLLTGRTDEVDRPRDEIVFHFPHYQTSAGPHSTIYLGQHKLIRFDDADKIALFDIDADPLEQNDLANDERRLARQLERRLDAYLDDVNAQRVEPNPDYDPDQPTQIKRDRRR